MLPRVAVLTFLSSLVQDYTLTIWQVSIIHYIKWMSRLLSTCKDHCWENTSLAKHFLLPLFIFVLLKHWYEQRYVYLFQYLRDSISYYYFSPSYFQNNFTKARKCCLHPCVWTHYTCNLFLYTPGWTLFFSTIILCKAAVQQLTGMDAWLV